MRNLIIILILTALCTSTPNAAEKKDKYEIGQKSVTYVDESRKRPLVTEIWYPTYDTEKKENSDDLPVFKMIQTIHNASIPDKKFPLLLVSHGTGGNRFSLTWFVERMVREGYIVVAMDHFGNSTFNKLPREFVKWWERAIDVKYVLTALLNAPDIGTKIDQSRIGGVGFSLGGYTNIALAGGYVNRKKEMALESNMPPEFPETEEAIDLTSDSQIVSSYYQYKDHVKDERIKAFFVMAPAIGPGFHTKKQVEEITAPIFIVAGKGDTNTPTKHNALNYHNLIEHSRIHLFDKYVGHYIFLNEATEFGKEILPEITIDHPKTDRKKIHDETLNLAIDFFEKNL